MKYEINDVLTHKNSVTDWVVTSKDYEYNNNNLVINKLYNLKRNNKNMLLNEIELFKYFIKKDDYKTYKSQNKLSILFNYINYYDDDLKPIFIKNDDNYIFYKLNDNDYLREILINDIIDCNNADLIYKAKQLAQNYIN